MSYREPQVLSSQEMACNNTMKKSFLTFCQWVFVCLGNTKEVVYYWACNGTEICDFDWNLRIPWFSCLFSNLQQICMALYLKMYVVVWLYGSIQMIDFIGILPAPFKMFYKCWKAASFLPSVYLTMCVEQSIGSFHDPSCPFLRLLWYEVREEERDCMK